MITPNSRQRSGDLFMGPRPARLALPPLAPPARPAFDAFGLPRMGAAVRLTSGGKGLLLAPAKAMPALDPHGIPWGQNALASRIVYTDADACCDDCANTKGSCGCGGACSVSGGSCHTGAGLLLFDHPLVLAMHGEPNGRVEAGRVGRDGSKETGQEIVENHAPDVRQDVVSSYATTWTEWHATCDSLQDHAADQPNRDCGMYYTDLDCGDPCIVPVSAAAAMADWQSHATAQIPQHRGTPPSDAAKVAGSSLIKCGWAFLRMNRELVDWVCCKVMGWLPADNFLLGHWGSETACVCISAYLDHPRDVDFILDWDDENGVASSPPHNNNISFAMRSPFMRSFLDAWMIDCDEVWLQWEDEEEDPVIARRYRKGPNPQTENEKRLCVCIAMAGLILHELLHKCRVGGDWGFQRNCNHGSMMEYLTRWAMRNVRYPEVRNSSDQTVFPCCTNFNTEYGSGGGTWGQIDPKGCCKNRLL